MERLNSEQLQTLDLHLLEWYYTQADIKHKDLVRVDDVITTRGYTLMTLYYAILAATIGYVITHLHLTTDLPLTYGCLSIITFTLVAIIYICRVIWPHKYMAPGKEPERQSIPQYTAYFKGKGIEGENQCKQVLGDELVVLQQKCEEMEEKNTRRTRMLSSSLIFLCVGTLLGVVLFILTAIVI